MAERERRERGERREERGERREERGVQVHSPKQATHLVVKRGD